MQSFSGLTCQDCWLSCMTSVFLCRKAQNPTHWSPSCCMLQYHNVVTVHASSQPVPRSGPATRPGHGLTCDSPSPHLPGADAFPSSAIPDYFALPEASSASTRNGRADLLTCVCFSEAGQRPRSPNVSASFQA